MPLAGCQVVPPSTETSTAATTPPPISVALPLIVNDIVLGALTVLSLGVFLLVVNTAMLALVAWMLPGFHVAGFWPAFQAALIVWVAGWLASWLIGPKGRIQIHIHRTGRGGPPTP